MDQKKQSTLFPLEENKVKKQTDASIIRKSGKFKEENQQKYFGGNRYMIC